MLRCCVTCAVLQYLRSLTLRVMDPVLGPSTKRRRHERIQARNDKRLQSSATDQAGAAPGVTEHR